MKIRVKRVGEDLWPVRARRCLEVLDDGGAVVSSSTIDAGQERAAVSSMRAAITRHLEGGGTLGTFNF